MSSPVPPPLGASSLSPQPTEPLATASLICGILSWVCVVPLTGIPAIICGHIARGRIARSGGALGGAGLAIAGLILGYLSTFALIAAVIVALTLGVAALPFMKQGVSSGMTTMTAMQIAQGVTAYQAQYGHLPLVATGAPEDARVDTNALLAVLQGHDAAANPQNTVFLQTLPIGSGKQTELDAWGQPFNVALDVTGDGAVKIGELNAPGPVGVWSSGPNKIDESGAGDDLTSWR